MLQSKCFGEKIHQWPECSLAGEGSSRVCVLHLGYLGAQLNGNIFFFKKTVCECWIWELAVCRRKLRHRVVCDHCWGKSNIDAELAVKKERKRVLFHSYYCLTRVLCVRMSAC